MDNQTSNKSLPAIEDLFKQAWATFKGTWVQLLVLYLIVFGVIVGTIFVLIILFAIFLGGGMIAQGFSPNNLLSSATNPAVLIPLFVFSVIGISVIIIAGLIGQIGTIKIVGSFPNKKTLGEIFHESFILPVLGVSILSSLLVMGGYMVFVIPGILFSIFFSFALYEVILDDKRGFQALRSSFALVSTNFWGFVLRILILIGIYFIYMMVVLGLTKAASSLSSLTNLIEVPFSWFVTAYIIALYKELKAKTGAKTEKSIGWIIGVSLIGWIFLIGLTILIASNANKIMPKKPADFQLPPGMGEINHPGPKITPYQNIGTSSSYTY